MKKKTKTKTKTDCFLTSLLDRETTLTLFYFFGLNSLTHAQLKAQPDFVSNNENDISNCILQITYNSNFKWIIAEVPLPA